MFDTGLEFSHWLLSGIEGDWGAILVVPLLVGLLLVAVVVIVQLLPVADRLIGPLGSGLATLVGMALLLPEYLCTLAIRQRKRAPPGFFHVYGEAVMGFVQVGRQASRAGLAAFIRGNVVRKLVILSAVVLIVAVGNEQSCPSAAARCERPLTVWWKQTKSHFAEDPPAKAKPKPTKKPTKKPTSKKTN